MKINELEVEDFKRLKTVKITPEPHGSLVVVVGRNAQGKSSVLDAIWAALAARKAPVEEPVRQGEQKARVRLDLGEIVVTRTWTAGGKSSRLVVESSAGVQLSSPQAVLDQLVGKFSFDPLAFANAKPADQRDTLLDLVGLDLATFDAERKRLYDERTLVNRGVKNTEGALESLPPAPPTSTPNEEISLSDTLTKVTRARELDVEIENLRSVREQLLRALEENTEQGRAAVQARALIPEATEALQEQLQSIDSVNRAVRAKRAREELVALLRKSKRESEALTGEIELVDQAKQRAIAQAGLPVEGLGFTDDGVTLNGVPFSQASAAERLRTSVAIAMAANPEIRVIRITDGSLLDDDNLAAIAAMAAEKDYQVWIERVGDAGSVGVVIEDGEVLS